MHGFASLLLLCFIYVVCVLEMSNLDGNAYVLLNCTSDYNQSSKHLLIHRFIFIISMLAYYLLDIISIWTLKLSSWFIFL